MKKTIRMNERELHRLISESVKRMLNESYVNDTSSYKKEAQDVWNKIKDGTIKAKSQTMHTRQGNQTTYEANGWIFTELNGMVSFEAAYGGVSGYINDHDPSYVRW